MALRDLQQSEGSGMQRVSSWGVCAICRAVQGLCSWPSQAQPAVTCRALVVSIGWEFHLLGAMYHPHGFQKSCWFLVRQYWCRCIQSMCCQDLDSAFSYAELGDVLVGAFFINFQLTWESGEVPVEWNLSNVAPFGRRKTLVITGLLVSLKCLVKLKMPLCKEYIIL